jgi:hypothetical protein
MRIREEEMNLILEPLHVGELIGEAVLESVEGHVRTP